MKKTLFMLAALAAVMLTGCKKPEEPKKEDPVTIDLAITDNADNAATVTATLLTGEAPSGKAVTVKLSAIEGVNYDDEITLINYVKENGKDITFPYTETLTKTIGGDQYLTAVIAFDKTGRAVKSAYQVWTAEGQPDGWSQNDNAGSLNYNQW